MLINEDGIPVYFPYFYAPKALMLENGEEHGVDYEAWAEAGDFTPTLGLRTDFSVLIEKVKQVAETNPILQCQYDKHHSYEIVSGLEELGIELIEATQACGPMNACTTEVIMRIEEGRLIHPHNAVLTWNAMNARINENKYGKMFDKKLSHKKIDGMVAMALATRGAIPLLTGGKEADLKPYMFPDA
jgi:phage terminase large subunit-like protein